MKALADIRKIVGLDAPKAVEVSGKDGAPIQVEYVNDWRNEGERPD